MNPALHAATSTMEFLAATPTDNIVPAAKFQEILGVFRWGAFALAALGLIIGGAMAALGHFTGDEHRRSQGIMITVGAVVASIAATLITAVAGTGTSKPSDSSASPTAAPTPPTSSTTPAPVEPSEPFNWTPVLVGLGIVVGLIAAAALVWFAVSKQRLHADAAAARRRKLDEANKIRDGIDIEYTAFLLDPADTLWKRPLLDDLHEPLTVAFLDAWRATTEAFLDLRPRQDESVAAALAAATEARTAWEIASRHAERIGLGDLSSADRAKLETARKMLDRALDPSVGQAERENCVARIASTLASITPRTEAEVTSVVRAKVTKALAIDTTARRAITGGE